MTNADDIRIRGVVALNHREVFEDHKGRALPACRQQDRRRPIVRHWSALHVLYAQVAPFGWRLFDLSIGQSVVEIGWQAHLDPPRLTRDPAKPLEVSRCRRKGVCRIIRPNVPLSIAGEIHRVCKVGRRDELRMTHCAGPGSSHQPGVYVACLNDFQSCNQLSFEELSASSVVRQRRKALDHIVVALVAAIRAFQTPNGDDDLLLHSVAPLNLFKDSALLSQCSFAVAHPRVGRSRIQVFPNRFGEFGLVSIAANNLGIVTHTSERPVEHCARNALCQRS